MIGSIDIGTINFAFVIYDPISQHMVHAVKENTRLTDIWSVICLLEQHKTWWDQCSVILVEKQMKVNPRACAVSQQVMTWFWTVYGPFKTIVEYPSQNKTRMLGCPKELRRKKKDRKNWCTEYAIRIMVERSDPWLPWVASLRKKDDVCDCLCQALSYKFNLHKK